MPFVEGPRGYYVTTLLLEDLGEAARPAVPALIRALKDPELRKWACCSLRNLGAHIAADAIGPLEELATKEHAAGVRNLAVGRRAHAAARCVAGRSVHRRGASVGRQREEERGPCRELTLGPDRITKTLFVLPEETLVYPGHDYKGRTASTIAEEKQHNPRLAGKTREQFIALMNQLGLPPPQKLAESVPANRACGKGAT